MALVTAGAVARTLAPSSTEADEIVEVVDDFDRATDDGLGLVPDGPAWTATPGWQVRQGRARVLGLERAPAPTVAAVDTGVRVGVIAAEGWRIRDGWALAFRFQGPRNHWRVVAQPSAGRYELVRVLDGTVEVVASADSLAFGDGTEVAVRLDGETIVVTADEVPTIFVQDREPSTSTAAGPMATDGRALSSGWTRFLARGT